MPDSTPAVGSAEELSKLIDGFKSATLTTRGVGGDYHARPMAVQKRETDDSIWFATLLDTEKVRDLRADPTCAVYFQDGQHSPTWISMSGKVDISQDRAKIKELWNPGMAAWFPDGPDQRDITLLHFHPGHVEYMKLEGGQLGAMLLAVKMFVFKQHAPEQHKKQLELR